MDLQGLQKIITTGLFSLANSLDSYWPVYDLDDIAERNLTAHVASSFLNNGFDVYFEVPISKKDKDKKIDCLFLSYEHKLFIACESKRLNGVKHAEGITDDIEKIHNFNLQNKEQEIEIESSYGLILAYTWKADIAKLWASKDDTGRLRKKRDPRWEKLGTFINRPDVEGEVLTLYHESEESIYKALYAIWQLNHK